MKRLLLILLLVLAVGGIATFLCFAPSRTDTHEVTGTSVLRGAVTMYSASNVWASTCGWSGTFDQNGPLDVDAADASLYAGNIANTGNGGGLYVNSAGTGDIVNVADDGTTFFGLEDGCAASTTWDPWSMTDGDVQTKSVTVTGAALGDFVLVSAPYDLEWVTATAYVQAASTVYILLNNESGGTVDLGSGTWRVLNIISH